MTALVLSAGGMYGAYQAGAWKVLAGVFRPDIVVGASIGAVNAWAIAGDCTPEELEQRWLNLDVMGRLPWRLPRRPWHGVLDSRPIQKMIQELHASSKPMRECGIVLTETRSLRPRLFRAPDITWRHLAASTAVPGIYEQYRIDGRFYSDGGLMNALPLWAAAQMGAKRIVAIDVLPKPSSAVVRAMAGSLRRVARFHPPVPADIEIIRFGPSNARWSPRDLVVWSRTNAAAWIREGETDAAKTACDIKACMARPVSAPRPEEAASLA